MKYTKAGHVGPYYYRRASDELERLTTTDMILGVAGFEQSRFETEERAWGKGDVLLLFSDGVPEALSLDDREFGEARLGELVINVNDGTPGELQGRILDALEEHCRGAEQSDDVTLVVAKET